MPKKKPLLDAATLDRLAGDKASPEMTLFLHCLTHAIGSHLVAQRLATRGVVFAALLRADAHREQTEPRLRQLTALTRRVVAQLEKD